MLIEKVDWVKHVTLRNQRSQIYSVDLHPDGTRFATGAGDSKIKIWSTKSLTDDSSGSEHSGGEEEEEAKLDADSSQPSPTGDSPTAAASGLMASRMMGPAKRSSKAAKESPELLAVLSTHTDPVNCVRWSNKGRFLASASDDRSIIIWELRAAGAPSSAPFGSEAVQNVENWSQVFVLQGHTLNIMDVNWSPDDSLLASASLDNHVIIWPMRAAHAGERGVINPLRILSSHENQVKGVAWDPVGKYLATSAQDHTVLVWRTSDWAVEAKVTKPFEESVKQESLFRRISWSPDGGVICATNATQKTRHLAAMIRRGEGWTSETSLVGHERPVVASRFCPAIFRKKDSASGQTKHSSILALGDDSTGMLTLWSTAKERPLLIIKDVFAGGTTDLTWSRDGRLVLASSLDGTVCMLSFEMGELKQGRPMNPSETAALFMRTFGSGAGDGTVLREHALPVRTGENGSASRSQQLQESPMPGSPPSSLPSYSPQVPLASAASGGGGGANWLQPRYKDGKKRIRPQLISSNGPPSLASASGEGMASPSAPKRPRPAGAPSSSSLVSSSVGPRPVVSVVLERESVRFTVECPYDKAGVLTRILSDFEGLGGHGDDLMDDGDTGGSRLPLTVDVSVSEAGTGPISHIQVSTGGEMVWKEVLPGRAKTVCGNGAIVAVGCLDGSVHVLGSGGLRLCPPLMMGSAVALLECTAVATPSSSSSSSGEGAVVGAMHVMGIDQAGGLRVWDVDRMRSVVNTSLRPIFSSLADAKPATAPTSSSSSTARPASTVLPKVIRAEVGRAGRPRLEVAMGGGPRSGVQAFVFDAALDAWMRVSDSRYVLSDFASSSSASGGGASLVAVSTLLREEEDKAMQRELTRAHVEDRLASAVAAQAKEDVLYYLRLLTTRLAKAGQVERLRALCDRLLGRVASEMEEAEGQQQGDDDDASLAYWRPEKKWLVRGELSKTEALRTVVLPIMAEAVEQAAVQRLYQQYHEATANAGGGRLLLS